MAKNEAGDRAPGLWVQARQQIAGELGDEPSAEDVVEFARRASPDSPIYRVIFADDSQIAEHKWRVQLARRLLAVKLKVTHSTFELKMPTYIRNPDKSHKDQGYIATEALRTKESRAKEALISEIEYVRSALNRMRAVSDALDLADEVEAAGEQIEGVLDDLIVRLRRPPARSVSRRVKVPPAHVAAAALGRKRGRPGKKAA